VSNQWQRLGDRVKARRLDPRIGLTQAELAKAAGIRSVRTIGTLERGGKVADTTLAKLEHPLFWDSGSCLAILNGGEPTALPIPTKLVPAQPPWRTGAPPPSEGPVMDLSHIPPEERPMVVRRALEDGLRLAREVLPPDWYEWWYNETINLIPRYGSPSEIPAAGEARAATTDDGADEAISGK
jgi:DNA-binding XRE family transcriptional regulator